ncbi:MAG: GTPase HflX [Acidobacteriota bacterium]|nr:GTPase HflX [Acidobacteriota bacterium]
MKILSEPEATRRLYTLDEDGPTVPRRAFLVGVSLGGEPLDTVEEHLDELEELVTSCGGQVLGQATQRRRSPSASTFIGSGKAQEIGEVARNLGAEVVVFDDDLSPSQIKNLEKATDLAVMDRSSVILEIFSRRARSREAKTQVELARLNYLLPRLTRRWSHLSRQAGGIGVRGGEGESQLEADRRMLRQRIKRLEKALVGIEKTRALQRRSRRRVPTVALAGYTNAGKSTLFNQLTQAGVKAQDRLFATLDARLRRGALDPYHVVIFADTVGFIRKLPHHLVSSFRSTLEEITEADLVLHVVDRSHPAWEDQLRVADEVLDDLGVEREKTLVVFNKVDRLEADHAPTAAEAGRNAVAVSALTGEGLDDLRQCILKQLFPEAAARDEEDPDLAYYS